MISIPLFVFLIIFALVVIASISLWCINVYHIISSASMTPVAFFITSSIALLSLLVIGGTWLLLGDVDWSMSVFDIDDRAFTNEGF